jgi:hypothetical protein
MRRHRAALIDVQCHCPGGTDGGGGIIRPSPWLQTPAATPQLGKKMPPLPVLLATASIEHDSGAKGTMSAQGGAPGRYTPGVRFGFDPLETCDKAAQEHTRLLIHPGTCRQPGDTETGRDTSHANAAARQTQNQRSRLQSEQLSLLL